MTTMQVLGAHLMPAFVGVGIAAVVAGAIAVAKRLNEQAEKARGPRRLLIPFVRYVFSLFCGVLISLPVIHLLLDLRIAATEFLAVFVGAAMAVYFLAQARLLGFKRPL